MRRPKSSTTDSGQAPSRSAGSPPQRLNLNEARIERCSAADIGEYFRSQCVDAFTVRRKRSPVQAGRHDAWLDLTVDLRAQTDLAPIVEHAHPIAFVDTARLSVSGAHLQQV